MFVTHPHGNIILALLSCSRPFITVVNNYLRTRTVLRPMGKNETPPPVDIISPNSALLSEKVSENLSALFL